jgi:integrase
MEIFLDMIEAAKDKTRYNPHEHGYCSQRDIALLCCLFQTGGRELEVAQLRKSMFKVEPAFVVVEDMPLVKRYTKTKITDERTGEEITATKPKADYRSFTFSRKEPLADLVVAWLDEATDYLFPTRRNSKQPYLHPTRIYQIVDDMSRRAGYIDKIPTAYGTVERGAMWVHRVRSERASYFGSVLKWDIEKIMRFFGWKTTDIAMRYAHKSVEDMKTWF